MIRCPACNAPTRGNSTCRRCRLDLTPILEIAEKARRHHQLALSAFHAGDFDAMFRHARRACSLRQSPASQRLLACSALLRGRFSTAISLRRTGPGG